MLPEEIISIQSKIIPILSHPTWDIIVVFAAIAIGFFYGISAGKRRIISTLLFTYIALALSSAIPWEIFFEKLNVTESFFVHAGAFLLIFLLLSWFLGPRRNKSFAPAGAWWQIFLLSFLQAGLLIHLILSFLPKEYIKLLAPVTKTIFANQTLHIWWLFVPLFIIIFLKRMEAREE